MPLPQHSRGKKKCHCIKYQLPALARDVTIVVRKGIQASPRFYRKVCFIVPSTSLEEKYAWIGDMP